MALVGPELLQTQPVRQELARRVIELDSIIEEAIGESALIRQNSPVLQAAVDGLLKALAGWRIVAVHLAQLPHEQAQQLAAIVSQAVPTELSPGFGGETRRDGLATRSLYVVFMSKVSRH